MAGSQLPRTAPSGPRVPASRSPGSQGSDHPGRDSVSPRGALCRSGFWLPPPVAGEGEESNEPTRRELLLPGKQLVGLLQHVAGLVVRLRGLTQVAALEFQLAVPDFDFLAQFGSALLDLRQFRLVEGDLALDLLGAHLGDHRLETVQL